jgi:hypothetical protein
MNEQSGKVSHFKWRPVTVVVSLVMLASLAIAGSASAAPKGAFAVFSDCPLTTAEACLYAKTETGEFLVGKKTVPITNPIVLQGGLKENPTTELQEFIAAKDGNTLSHSPQNVPGGLSGLVNCKEIKGEGLLEKLERGSCESIFENGLTGVSATTELAGPASSILVREGNLIEGTGTALQLPLKVHLENPLLGSSCYIGSNSAPIVIAFTTGTTSPPLPNKPIKGAPGVNEFIEEGEIFRISKNSLVNNSFAAPKTNGCGGFAEILIGPIINAALGVPAAAGTNTAILNGTLEQSGVESVKAHE